MIARREAVARAYESLALVRCFYSRRDEDRAAKLEADGGSTEKRGRARRD